MIRVCFAINNYPPAFGGHGIQIARNLPFLRERGIEAEVVTRATAGLRGTETVDGTKVHRVLTPGDSAAAKLRRIGELRGHLRRNSERYSLLHSTVLGWELFANTGLARRLGLPIVLELIRLGGDDPDALSQQAFGRIKLRCLRNVDTWLAISDTFRSHIAASGVAPDDLTIVPTGVDFHQHTALTGPVRREERTRLGLPADGRIVLSVGSLLERKGFDRALEAWSHAKPRRGRDLLVIAGPATAEEGLTRPEPHTALRLYARARAPELDGTVRFTGRLDDVARWMAISDAFLFLSYHEGLGTVILEAMASSLPCMVSPLYGVSREIIESGETGFIASDPVDAASVGATLRQLLDDADLRRQVGSAARVRSEARYSLEARADALVAIYQRVART